MPQVDPEVMRSLWTRIKSEVERPIQMFVKEGIKPAKGLDAITAAILDYREIVALREMCAHVAATGATSGSLFLHFPSPDLLLWVAAHDGERYAARAADGGAQ